ncbi:hypothetical protein [Allosphingosinicella sp.]|uniref:hypothetical protein n=1 Tax=Allosphingosinicella sp. TaxID=2823234 RepID=UPI0037836E59
MKTQKQSFNRVSSSRNGGWPLFCRLLLWATRNNHACERVPDSRPQAKPAPRRQPLQRIADGIPACSLVEAGSPSKT